MLIKNSPINIDLALYKAFNILTFSINTIIILNIFKLYIVSNN